MIDGIGEVFTPFAQLRGDIYNVSGVNNATQTGSQNLVTPNPDNGFITRGDAVAGFEYRYPFVATTGSVTHIFEPIAQIIARPNSAGPQQDIPNEDALSLVFDDTLLFDIDKFSGSDRIETGTRANVGFRYTAQLLSGAYLQAVFGQSYQIAGQNAFDNAFYSTTGLATDASDYVTGLYLQATSNVSFTAQTRFDVNTLDMRRSDLGAWLRYGPAQLKVNYADVTAEPGLAAGQPAQEILTAAVLALTKDWSLLGNIRYDLNANHPIDEGLGVQYQDDCFLLAVTYQKSNITDQDIKPDERILVNFNLKYLGAYQYSTSVSDTFGTAANPTIVP